MYKVGFFDILTYDCIFGYHIQINCVLFSKKWYLSIWSPFILYIARFNLIYGPKIPKECCVVLFYELMCVEKQKGKEECTDFC